MSLLGLSGGDTGDSGGGEDGDIEPDDFDDRCVPIFSSEALLNLKLFLYVGDCMGDLGDNGAFDETFKGGRYNRGLSDRCFKLDVLPPLPLLLQKLFF